MNNGNDQIFFSVFTILFHSKTFVDINDNVAVTGFFMDTEIIDSLCKSEKQNSNKENFVKKYITGNEIKFALGIQLDPF